MPDRLPTSGDSNTHAKPSEGGYRWRCPYCGVSRVNQSDGEAGREHAIAALRAHIQASDGNGHGPKNNFPKEFLTLSKYIEKTG